MSLAFSICSALPCSAVPTPHLIKLHHSSLTLLAPAATRRRPRMDGSISSSFQHDHHRRKDKVVVIMGTTCSGKSRLSIDLATLFPSSEILNADKMQVYRGLDITTNKIPLHHRNGVPHHLLGEVDPSLGDFSPSDFRRHAAQLISDISSRQHLPLLVGGSNSIIHALLVQRFNPNSNVFQTDDVPISSELRYNCCCLWVDISFPVLSEYLLKRVDDMLDSGAMDELARFYDPDAGDLELDSAQRTGLRRAIGVAEFDRFFKLYPPGERCEGEEHRVQKNAAYEEAVRAIKENTCQLAKRQIEKILRLKRAGWDIRRIDATEVCRAVLTSPSPAEREKGSEDIWKTQVLEPSVNIVKRFLME